MSSQTLSGILGCTSSWGRRIDHGNFMVGASKRGGICSATGSTVTSSSTRRAPLVLGYAGVVGRHDRMRGLKYKDRFKTFVGPLMEMAFSEERSKYDCLLFDLDDTLYPLSSDVTKGFVMTVKEYLVEKLGIDRSKRDRLCYLLYKNYGTTLAGLRAIGYDIDYDEYHSFINGKLPCQKLRPDPVLRSLLLSLPYQKIIFTNSDKAHAGKVLSMLGLEDCFKGVICFETLNPTHKPPAPYDYGDVGLVRLPATVTSPATASGGTDNEIFDIVGHFSGPKPSSSELPVTPVLCKPSEDAIEMALKVANVSPERTVFFDDSIRNIQAGKRVGLRTVLVGRSRSVKGADYALESIHNLKEALPELWEDVAMPLEADHPGKPAVETFVTA